MSHEFHLVPVLCSTEQYFWCIYIKHVSYFQFISQLYVSEMQQWVLCKIWLSLSSIVWRENFSFEVFSYFFGTILLKTSELQQLQSKILLRNYKLHKYLRTSNDDSTTCKLKAQLKTHWRKRSVLFDLWVEVFLFSCTSTPLSLWEAEKEKVHNMFFHTYFWSKRNAFHSGKSQCDRPDQAWIYFCCPHYRGGILMTGWPSGYLEIMVFVIIVAPDCMEWEWWLLLVMVCTWT